MGANRHYRNKQGTTYIDVKGTVLARLLYCEMLHQSRSVLSAAITSNCMDHAWIIHATMQSQVVIQCDVILPTMCFVAKLLSHFVLQLGLGAAKPFNISHIYHWHNICEQACRRLILKNTLDVDQQQICWQAPLPCGKARCVSIHVHNW